MADIFIKNRKNQKLSLVVDQAKNQSGLVFILHGLGGFKEQPQIKTFTKAFKDNNYTTVIFDVADTIGASEPGNTENTCITHHYEDLEDVITWAATQFWYQEPFCLAGHSLGGIAITLFAENNPHKIKALAPISTVISGELSLTMHSKQELKEWQTKGYNLQESHSKPGVIKKIKWQEIEDRLKYDLLPKANQLIMPTILIVGNKDEGTPLEHQKLFLDALPAGKKELHIIKNASHTFRDKKHLDEIYLVLDNWLKKI